eukprot:2024116-Prorocentrum_lima.AAC.1
MACAAVGQTDEDVSQRFEAITRAGTATTGLGATRLRRDEQAAQQGTISLCPSTTYKRAGIPEPSPYSHLHGNVLSVPMDTLPSGELNFIFKAIQSRMGKFPDIEMDSMTSCPDQLRKWRYVVSQILEAGGQHVVEWWSWCWRCAESVYDLYLKASTKNSEGIE